MEPINCHGQPSREPLVNLSKNSYMKLQRSSLYTLGAAVLLALQPTVNAATVTAPAEGDIFLGFRASGGTGANSSYLVKVANGATLSQQAANTTQSLATIGADLAAVYGANWNTRSDLYWGFFGAFNSANPTVYASRAQLPFGTPAAEFNVLQANARTATKNQIISVRADYATLQATANHPAAAVQNNAARSNSYNYQITGGTTSFGSLSQWSNIEDNFGATASGTALDLFRLSGSATQGDLVKRLGTFSITTAGAVSFTAAPVVNQISVEKITYTFAEDAGNAVIKFVRSGDLSGAATANFTITDATALANTDYTLPGSLQVSFAADQAEATVSVPLTDRASYQGSRAFTVALASATGGFSVHAPLSTTVTISDTDPSSLLGFALAEVVVPQQTAGAPTNATLTILRTDGVTDNNVSVRATITGGTLVAGNHYTFTSPQTVSLASGETSKTLSIPLTANVIVGTIVVTLDNPQGGAGLGANTVATLTVAPNAGAVAFSAPTFAASTAATSYNVTLNRTGGSEGAVSVDVSATSATLVNGVNFTYTNPTTVNFAAGATTASTTVQFPAPIIGDITLTLSNPTNFVTLGTQATATLSIAGAPGAVSFAQAEYNVFEEAGIVNLQLVRTDGATGPLSVTVSTQTGTASATDFTALNAAPVNFADGQTTATVPVTINVDTVKNEANEAFTVNLAGESLGALTTATVRILDLDTVKPTVTITTPKANAKILESAGPSVIVTGTAKDNKGVAKVEVKINDGEFAAAPFTEVKGVANYTQTVTAEPGNNLITVRSTDHRNNVSLLVTRSFVYDDPYPAIAGTYTGLVSADEDSTPAHATEGLVSVIIAAKGIFTGKLTIDGATHAFTGSIPPSGVGQFVVNKVAQSSLPIVRKGKANLGLALEFDLRKTGNSNTVTGTVSVANSAVASEFVADRALYTNKKNPVLPLMNPAEALWKLPYTLLFKAPTAGDASAVPQGDGWGSITISNAGVAKVTGTLADGTAITFSAPLSLANRLPFYVPLYKNLGSISGPVKFENLTATDVDAEDLYWFRPADAKSKVYPLGWAAGINVDLRGSKFVKAVAKTDTESSFGFVGNGTLTVSQGTLTENVVKSFSITVANKVTNAAADKTFTLTVAGATGIFSGTFTPPGQTKKPAFKGVVLQKSGEASGFFLSTATTTATSQSGKVTVTEQVNPE